MSQEANAETRDWSNNTNLTLKGCRRRIECELIEMFESRGYYLLEALPAMGKSYSAFKVAASTDTDITYLTSLNRLKDQAEDWCEEFGLKYHRIPTPHSSCPSFHGDEDTYLAKELQEDYNRGVSATELHDLKSLPCEEEGPCPYLKKLEKDVSDVQVLIGNPKHAYNPSYIEGRVVIKDEFSENEYESCFNDLEKIIGNFLRYTTLPFDDYQDLLEKRSRLHNDDISSAHSWFKEYGPYRDTQNALKASEYHVYAPLLTYGLIWGAEWKLGNGWERVPLETLASLDDLDYVPVGPDSILVRDGESDSMFLLNPPCFEIADGFIGLDGTPTPELWGFATGLDLTHRSLLSEREKKEYVSNVLNYEIIQTNESEKAYSGGGGVTTSKDTKIAHGITLREGEKPGLISSKRAIENEYPEENNGEIFDYLDSDYSLTFAEVPSSNELTDKHLGFISGYRHYGDRYIQKWGAYANETVSSPETRGPAKSYGDFGDKVHQHLKNQTLQDVFRFGRDEEPTKVYVNTSVLPTWVPIKKGESPPLYNQSTRETAEYLRSVEEPASAKQISDQIDRHKSTVTRRLSDLVDEGLVEKVEQEGHNEPNLYRWASFPK